MADVLAITGARRPRPDLDLAATPTSTLTGAEVMAPYSAVAKAVGFLGEKVEEIGRPFQREAGANAVTRGPDGEIRFTPKFEFTQGDREYNAAGQQAALAGYKTDIAREITKLHVEHDGDPAAFQAAAEKWATGVGKGVPHLRAHLEAEASAQITQHFLGLTKDKHSRDLRRNEATLQARMGLLADELESHAFQGDGQSDEFKRKREEYLDLQRQRAANPKLIYSPEEAEIDKQRFDQRLTASAIVGQARRSFEKHGNLEMAQREAEQALDTLGLDTQARNRFLGQINARLGGAAAVRSAQAQERVQEADLLIGALRRGDKIDEDRVDALARELNGLRRGGKATELLAQREVARVMPIILTGTAGQRAEALTRLRKAAATGGNVVDAIIGAESGGDPGAKNQRSSATGLGQFIEETWVEMVGRYRPDLAGGRSRSEVLDLRRDPAIAREMVQNYATENAARLRDAGLPETPGNVYLAHFAGGGGAIALLRSPAGEDAAAVLSRASGGRQSREELIRANPFLEGMTVAGVRSWAERKVAGAAGENPIYASTVKQVQVLYDEGLARTWEPIKAAFDAGLRPSRTEIEGLATLLPLTSKRELAEEIAKRVSDQERLGRIEAMPARAVAAAAENLRQQGERGQLDAAGRETLALLERQQAAVQKTLAEDPLDRARTGPLSAEVGPHIHHAVTAPLDLSGPDPLKAQLGLRATAGRAVAEHEGVPIPSVLRKQDVPALRQALQTGDASTVATFFGGISGLDNDVLFATLGDKKLSETVEGLTNTKDPDKYTAALQGMDQLYRRDRERFAKAFGNDAVAKVEGWQARLSFETRESLAKTLSARPDEGRMAKIRGELEAGADTFAKKKDANDIMRDLRSVFEFGSRTPTDVPSRVALLADYRTALREAYPEAGDLDAAHKTAITRLGTMWRTSPTNGGILMKHRPEDHYPTIDRSHDWMRAQLTSALKERLFGITLGRAATDYDAATTPVTYTLVATPQTQADIAAGRKDPEYGVVYADPKTGKLNELRWRFDPTAGEAARGARFERQRAAAGERRRGMEALATIPSLDELSRGAAGVP